MTAATGAAAHDLPADPPVPLIVFCHVALDERNGGGMRTLISYIGRLDYCSVLSVHFGDTAETGQTGLRAVRYLWIAKRRFPMSLLAYYRAARRAVRSAGFQPVCILFTNTWSDLLLGVAATFASTRTCVWLMDDFITTLTQDRSVRGRLAGMLFRLLYRRAARRITVCAPMAHEYERRYGKRADLLLGKRWARSELRPQSSRASAISAAHPLRLVWVGKYQPYYHEPIADLSAVLRRHPHLPVTLDLYGQVPPDPSVLLVERVSYRGQFDDAALLPLLRGYDYGLLTFSFDVYTRIFMRYSFPGKLIDYVSAGLPVVTVAPRALSICDTVEARDIGPCLFCRDSAAMLAMLHELLEVDAARVERWRANGLAWAASEFVFEDGVRDLRRLFGVWTGNVH